MKRFVFTYEKGSDDKVKEIAEYDYDVTNEEVQSDFDEWVLNQIGDKFNWYKEE